MLRKVRSYYQSSSFKMALFFTLMLGITLCILGYFVFYFSRGHFIHGTEMTIETDISHYIKWEQQGLLQAAINDKSLSKNKVLHYTDENGVYISGNLVSLPKEVSLFSQGTILFDWNNQKFAAQIHKFSNGHKILIGVNIDEKRKNFFLMEMLGFLSIILVGSVIFVSFAISVFVVSRTNRIAAAAKDIMETGNLSKRIEVDSKWDDLSYVTTVLNSFLSRIESLIENIKQVSDNIAHDLRTPLTRLRNDLENLRDRKEKTTEDYERVIGEADHVLNIFSALLRISKIESGQGRNYFKSIDLLQILNDVKDLYEPLAEDKNISLNTDIKNYIFCGDRDLLFQAFANLLDNAIKFTPDNGQIRMALTEDGVFSIHDTGIGVHDDEKEKIFRRFYRAESARAMQGNGLGLSLVMAVMGLHGLKIDVENSSYGLKFIINFGKKLRITNV